MMTNNSSDFKGISRVIKSETVNSVIGTSPLDSSLHSVPFRMTFGLSLSVMAVLLSSLLFSCGGNEQQQSAPTKEETKINVYCDQAIYDFLKPVFHDFDSIYSKKYQLTVTPTTAWEAMAKFLNQETRVMLLARDYTRIEDSLIRSHGMEPYLHIPMAYDGLVFYTGSGNSSIDTLTDEQLRDVFTNKGSGLKKYYPKLAEEPEFVTNSLYSSELENLKKLVARNKPLAKQPRLMNGYDSVVKYVLNHPTSIGVGYLSQVINKPGLKYISISFYDSTGKYVFPHTVHQANFLQRLYPYEVPYYVYLLDKKSDMILQFARFMSRSGISQKYYNNAGIVPAYAEIKLKEE